MNWIVVPALPGFSALVLNAGEKPPAEFQKAMKDMAAFSGAIDKAVAADDYETITKLSNTAKDAFTIVEAYFNTHPSGTASAAARDAIKTSFDVNVAANMVSKEGAVYSTKILKDSCGACHTAHREKGPDGSFEIK